LSGILLVSVCMVLSRLASVLGISVLAGMVGRVEDLGEVEK
jgi:hypothetical protein